MIKIWNWFKAIGGFVGKIKVPICLFEVPICLIEVPICLGSEMSHTGAEVSRIPHYVSGVSSLLSLLILQLSTVVDGYKKQCFLKLPVGKSPPGPPTRVLPLTRWWPPFLHLLFGNSLLLQNLLKALFA